MEPHKTISQVLEFLENIYNTGRISEAEYISIKKDLEFQSISAKYSDQPYVVSLSGCPTTTDMIYDYLQSLVKQNQLH